MLSYIYTDIIDNKFAIANNIRCVALQNQLKLTGTHIIDLFWVDCTERHVLRPLSVTFVAFIIRTIFLQVILL